MNIGELAARRDELRELRRALAEQDRLYSAEIEQIDNQLLTLLDEQGVSAIQTNGVAISVSEDTLPTVNDWNALTEYILQTSQLHLLQRRMSSAAYRELLEQGIEIPGVSPFTKRSINMRRTT